MRKENPDVWVQATAAKVRVESGKYECSGRFSVNGRATAIVSGEAAITSADGPVAFSAGTAAVVNGQRFTYRKGKWLPAAAGADVTTQ